jgi:hypothetical protein
MKKNLLAAVLFVLTLPAWAAFDVAGVAFDDAATVGSDALRLNGTGIRTLFFFKVYAIGLYLPQKQTAAAAALAGTGAKRVRIVMLRSVGAEKLADAFVEGIRNNNSAAELAPLESRIGELRTALLSQKEIVKGATILLEWLPASGTRISFNGQAFGHDIGGEDFYRALLRIWLGDHPVDADLKAALLGRAG